MTPIELKEIVYQAVPYVGIAKVIDFLQVTNDVLAERGIQLPLAGQSTTTPVNRMEKGLTVQKQLSVLIALTIFMQPLPSIRSTSSDTCLQTASAITSLAEASTFRRVNC